MVYKPCPECGISITTTITDTAGVYLHAHTGDVVKFQNKHKFIYKRCKIGTK